MVATSDLGVLAVSLLGTPFFTDATIFTLRSIEYALMILPYPVHHHRNPLYIGGLTTLILGGLTTLILALHDRGDAASWI